MKIDAIPPNTTVHSIRMSALSRFLRNFAFLGTSWATSRAVSRAAMPPDALHTATRMAIITVAREPLEVRVVADFTASVNTVPALPGRALLRPLTSLSTWVTSGWSRLTSPSRAMSAGNRARNQW